MSNTPIGDMIWEAAISMQRAQRVIAEIEGGTSNMLIQDVKPYSKEEEAEIERGHQEHTAMQLPQEVMISELHNRGVTIEDIFAQYYAEEEMASHRSDQIFGNDEEGLHGRQADIPKLTVGDARLAGYDGVPPVKADF